MFQKLKEMGGRVVFSFAPSKNMTVGILKEGNFNMSFIERKLLFFKRIDILDRSSHVLKQIMFLVDFVFLCLQHFCSSYFKSFTISAWIGYMVTSWVGLGYLGGKFQLDGMWCL